LRYGLVFFNGKGGIGVSKLHVVGFDKQVPGNPEHSTEYGAVANAPRFNIILDHSFTGFFVISGVRCAGSAEYREGGGER
jgi:hypothetical protein